MSRNFLDHAFGVLYWKTNTHAGLLPPYTIVSVAITADVVRNFSNFAIDRTSVLVERIQ